VARSVELDWKGGGGGDLDWSLNFLLGVKVADCGTELVVLDTQRCIRDM
jgi:hypothetical protein